jgi:nucleotide-binding universal stress UspA family protein
MYRTILVHVDAAPGAAERIRLAVELAQRFEAGLIGLAAALPRPPVEAITAGVMDASLLEVERDQIAADFRAEEAQFHALAGAAGLKREWRAADTFPAVALAEAASAADIVIIGRVHAGFAGDDYRTADPGDLVMRTGRPVLIVPPGVAALHARNVVVAWKGTREARRAVADAMPFLERAEEVRLMEVSEGDEPGTVGDAAAFLAAHGVKHRAETVPRDPAGVAAQLAAAAEQAAADLIVAGAYGHTRIRELVFGGVTRSLIISSPVPCLLSH